MRRLALATIAAALIVPGAAHAALAPADSYPQLGQVLPIARAAWPDSPCRDREMVSIEPAPLINSSTGVRSYGTAQPGTCNLRLEDSLIGQPELMCWVVTHELGHLSGIWEHSTDPNSIMAPGGRYAPCHVLAPAPPVVAPVLTQPSVTPPVQHAKAKHKKTKHRKCRQHNKKKRRACKRRHR